MCEEGRKNTGCYENQFIVLRLPWPNMANCQLSSSGRDWTHPLTFVLQSPEPLYVWALFQKKTLTCNFQKCQSHEHQRKITNYSRPKEASTWRASITLHAVKRSSVKETAGQRRGRKRRGFSLHSSILPGKFHGQRSLAGYSWQGREATDRTEQGSGQDIALKCSQTASRRHSQAHTAPCQYWSRQEETYFAGNDATLLPPVGGGKLSLCLATAKPVRHCHNPENGKSLYFKVCFLQWIFFVYNSLSQLLLCYKIIFFPFIRLL